MWTSSLHPSNAGNIVFFRTGNRKYNVCDELVIYSNLDFSGDVTFNCEVNNKGRAPVDRHLLESRNIVRFQINGPSKCLHNPALSHFYSKTGPLHPNKLPK